MSAAVINRLAGRIAAAQDALRAQLLKEYPIGTRLAVNLRAGQVTPTPATVALEPQADRFGGSVRVLIDGAKKHSRNRYRSIGIRAIASVLSRPGSGS